MAGGVLDEAWPGTTGPWTSELPAIGIVEMTVPVWKGSISFGLVSVPVKAFTAARDHTIHFHQLDRATSSRIRNHTVSETTGKDVDRDDMVLGYEVSTGTYVTFERDELEELRPANTRALEVRDFVPLEDVDPIHYQRTYWLAPDGDAAAEPYALLLRAMQDKGRVGVGSVVMRNKQHLAAVRPLDGALALSTMRFEDEIVDRSTIPEIPKRASKADPKAVKLAGQIIDALAGDWDPSQYQDTYVKEVMDIITAKSKGMPVAAPAPVATDRGGATDLMAALKASLDQPVKRTAAKTTTGKRSRVRKPA